MCLGVRNSSSPEIGHTYSGEEQDFHSYELEVSGDFAQVAEQVAVGFSARS